MDKFTFTITKQQKELLQAMVGCALGNAFVPCDDEEDALDDLLKIINRNDD